MTQVIDPLSLLRQVRLRMTQQALADRLQTNKKTIYRWERGLTRCPQLVAPALQEILRMNRSSAPDKPASFTFADLFAGIGGIRIGFERAGGRCVFTSEWNEWSKKTYLENFGDGHPFEGDITQVAAKDIPDHDVLLAGFPCQPFSIAGVSKKNALGRPHGFECSTQGTLFFDIERIISEKKPKAFLLENVKNLVSHDRGNTFRVIREVLEGLGYKLHWRVIDGKSYVPQHRERILIVGFREDTDFTWDDLQLPPQGPDVVSILHPEDGSEEAERHYTTGPRAEISPRYTLTKNLWDYLRAYAAKHQAAGNGFGYGLVRPGTDRHTRTLSARYYKDGSEILIERGRGKRPRRLTPRECARLMGFPDDFRIIVSDTQAYRQFGNSVVVPVMEAVAKIMAPRILEIKAREAGEVTQPRLRAA
ncbi:DNA (cytosine-5-)-methyltransferase [Dokdonella sp. MW10]|uniref:DNA (cytosine-5-)-methyltransferase n=1 Tax=Dokdonella sp. MW10 TaxID=2992926 RepID=UPI003F7D56E5